MVAGHPCAQQSELPFGDPFGENNSALTAEIKSSHTSALHALGRAVQVDPIKPNLKLPGIKRLKLNSD